MVNLAAGGYATPADLLSAGWVDDLPDGDVVGRLRSASLRVALACQRNPYVDVPAGGDAVALRDAVCAQAKVWIRSGIDPSDLGVSEAAVKASTVLDGKLEYDTAGQARARAAAVDGLSAEAVAILTAAALIWLPTPTGDTSGCLPTFGLTGPVATSWAPLAERQALDSNVAFP